MRILYRIIILLTVANITFAGSTAPSPPTAEELRQKKDILVIQTKSDLEKIRLNNKAELEKIRLQNTHNAEMQQSEQLHDRKVSQ